MAKINLPNVLIRAGFGRVGGGGGGSLAENISSFIFVNMSRMMQIKVMKLDFY